MPWRSLLEYTQVCFCPYLYFQGILMKVNGVRYKWVRYSRVNANRTQTESRTVVNHFSWAARCSYCDVTSKISWLTMFWGRWVGWFFVKFNQLLKISLECTSYTNVMILLSVIFRLQWYQIQSSLKSINHLFKEKVELWEEVKNNLWALLILIMQVWKNIR